MEGAHGNDVMAGDEGDDQLFGDSGDDLLDGGSGLDYMAGGAGDDVFVFDFADLAAAGTRWFGQEGSDTVKFGIGQVLDLTALGDDRITGVDVIDLTVDGPNATVLTASDVRALSDSATLRIAGTTEDNATAHGAWSQLADVQIGADLYHAYTVDGATLLMDADVNLTLA